MVQLLDTVNHFPVLLNNNNNKAEPDPSLGECPGIQDTLCNTFPQHPPACDTLKGEQCWSLPASCTAAADKGQAATSYTCQVFKEKTVLPTAESATKRTFLPLTLFLINCIKPQTGSWLILVKIFSSRSTQCQLVGEGEEEGSYLPPNSAPEINFIS